MMVKNFFILQLGVKVKKSKRYIKKQNNKPRDWDIISPLRFTDDEWSQISSDGTCQNRCKSDIFKEPNGSIHYNGAFTKRATSRYSFATKEWTENKNPICWHGGLFEYKDNILTGRYFSICLLQQHDINKGWMSKPTQIINCVELEDKAYEEMRYN